MNQKLASYWELAVEVWNDLHIGGKIAWMVFVGHWPLFLFMWVESIWAPFSLDLVVRFALTLYILLVNFFFVGFFLGWGLSHRSFRTRGNDGKNREDDPTGDS